MEVASDDEESEEDTEYDVMDADDELVIDMEQSSDVERDFDEDFLSDDTDGSYIWKSILITAILIY